jgi:hypothetical protein
MTPQSPFMVVAPIRHGQIDALREVLRGMIKAPGVADPDNALIPFGRFERLHFARLVVLEDATLADRVAGGAPALPLPVALAFLGDCDGPAEAQLAEFVTLAEAGLRTIFAHCEDYDDATDLIAWLQARSVAPATFYANWVGRTVRQVHQEAALHQALRSRLALHAQDEPPQAVRAALLDYVAGEQRNGRLPLSPSEPTPPDWQVRQVLDAIWVPLVLLLLLPIFLLAAVPFLIVLRRRERTDIEIFPRPTMAHEAALAAIEDLDVSNQFSAFGSCKPGAFRLWLLRFLLWAVQYSTRHIYVRGRLSRVGTIHFARWVLLDDNQRLLFASNYDGSLDSYMDDFINKVGWGLNLVFSNGIGYPRTKFMVLGGAKNEQAFKYYLRRHQLPTDVWFKAYPGLTALDLARNSRIRAGLQPAAMSDDAARRWIALI